MSEFRDLPPLNNEGLTTSAPPEQNSDSLRRIHETAALLAAETNSQNLRNHLHILRDTMAPAEAAQALALGVRGGKTADRLPTSVNLALDAVAGAFGRARSAVSPETAYAPTEADRQQLTDHHLEE